jgi:hypothetical protein
METKKSSVAHKTKFHQNQTNCLELNITVDIQLGLITDNHYIFSYIMHLILGITYRISTKSIH